MTDRISSRSSYRPPAILKLNEGYVKMNAECGAFSFLDVNKSRSFLHLDSVYYHLKECLILAVRDVGLCLYCGMFPQNASAFHQLPILIITPWF